ncbi:MAG: carboxypeptidase regulatory-like domain-containing protein [Pyrinomonadaceae bacterium]
MRKFTNFLLAGLLLLLAQAAIQAQTTGSLSGSVSDPNGAAVIGATVTLKNNATGEGRTTTTNDRGTFAFSNLNPGLYSVTVENTGFKKSLASDIAVSVSNEAQLSITLEVGLANETVTVTSAQDVINTSSPSLTNVIDTRQVRDLPLPTRNPLDLAALQAGIAVTGTDTRGSSVGGLRQTAVNVTQDGINAMDNFVKTSSFFAISAPSLNSTAEFSITTGTVGSEAGRGAAQVNLVTKGGSNDFHGGIFYLHRNDALNANSFFSNSSGTNATTGLPVSPRARQRQHFFGFDIGGPVHFLGFGEGKPAHWSGKDKAFFFFSYEGFRENFSATRNRTVLTPSARTGLFSYTRTCPNPPGACVPGVETVNLLAIGNVAALNPITMALINSTPLPNNTLVGDGFNTAGHQFGVSGSDVNDKYVGRYDHQLVKDTRAGSHKFEFVYNRATFSLNPDTFNGLEAPFPGGINAFQSSVRQLVTGALVSTFGSSMTNVFRYGRQWAPVAFQRDSNAAAPYTVFSGITNPENQFQSQGRETIVDQYSNNFSVTKGAHLFRIGGDYQKVFADTFNDAGINPAITLGTNTANGSGILLGELPFGTTANLTAATSVYSNIVGNLASAAATFNVTSASSGFVSGATRSRIFEQKLFSVYGQDQWRFKSNVTLNIGMRWEFQAVPTIPNGLAIQPKASDIFGVSGFGNLFRPNAPAGPPPPVATQNFVSGTTGIPLYNNDWNNFAPFIGLAYSPDFKSGLLRTLFGESGKSSIRLGYSISYLQDGFTVISNALGTGTTNPGLIQTAANTTPVGVLTGAGVPLTTPTFAIPISDKTNFDINPGNGLWAIDPDLRVPYVQQWNAGYEREIFANTALEVRYVGNRATKVWRAVDFNEVNIFENGFLNEFLNAQRNYNLYVAANPNCALTGGVGNPCRFGNSGLAGQVNLPIMSTFFTGLTATSANGFASSTFIGNLTGNNVATFASTLAFSNTYKANRQNAALGIPANFFVANPNAAFARLLGNDSMSNYHSLQVELRRRFSNGLQFQADYTFSKSLTDAADASGNNQSDLVSFRTLRDKGLDYRRSNQDQTHRFVANAIYELPFGRGRTFLSGANGLVDRIVGGWTLGGIVTWATRPPFFINAGRTTFNSFNSANNPAQLLGITFEEFKKNIGVFRRPEGIYFINPDLLNITTNTTTGRFVSSTLKPGLLGAPAPGTFGNFPLNSLNGPNFFNVDMSLVKRIPVTETVRLELKTTLINALNHPSFVYNGNAFDSTSFGLITSQSGSQRIIHFTGSVRF